jgi:hypothetical protein
VVAPITGASGAENIGHFKAGTVHGRYAEGGSARG